MTPSPAPASWVPDAHGSGFDVDHLPYGIVAPHGAPPVAAVRIGGHALPLAAALADPVFAQPTLRRFMAQGPSRWREVRERLVDLLADERHRGDVAPLLVPLADVRLLLPVAVGDYVDFFASLAHATNVGEILRPGGEPLPPAWRHLPIGYHGRSGTIVVSGTPIPRPSGQRQRGHGDPELGPTERLDLEAEVGFVVGAASTRGTPVAVDDVDDHVFGVVLVNDWSARDIQAWETRPLGPMLGKSFATSIGGWITPLDALAAARVAPAAQVPPPLAYLRGGQPWTLDLRIEVDIDGAVVSRPPFATMYWTPAQMLAHLTSNGAHVRTGDLLASGTVSGPARHERGCLLELTWGGAEPRGVPAGTERTWLEDGETVTMRASAAAPGGGRIDLAEVSGTVQPPPRAS